MESNNIKLVKQLQCTAQIVDDQIMIGDDLMKLWNWWLLGGIKGNKRYIILPILESLAIPFGIWFFGDRDDNFWQFLTTPKMIIVMVICLIGGGTLFYVLDSVVRINKKMKN